MEDPEDLVMDRGVILCPVLLPDIGRNLEDISDQDENPLDDQLVILEPFIPILLQESPKSFGKNSPQLLVNKCFFVTLTVVLDLEEEIASFLVLWQLLLEEKQLGVCQVDKEPQGDIEQLPVVAVISEDWEKITFDNREVPKGSPNFMIVVIPP